MYNGYEIWRQDVDRCTTFRIMNQKGAGCGRCIKVCPWNKPEGWSHDLIRWMVNHTPALDSAIVKMDGLWGYGKQNSRGKWWLDIISIDGVHQILRTVDK